jgi:hypothetical protein
MSSMPVTKSAAAPRHISRVSCAICAILVILLAGFVIWLRFVIAPGEPAYQEILLPSRFVWASQGFWFILVSFVIIFLALFGLIFIKTKRIFYLLFALVGTLLFQLLAMMQSMSHLIVHK